jgi:hypothetical protein
MTPQSVRIDGAQRARLNLRRDVRDALSKLEYIAQVTESRRWLARTDEDSLLDAADELLGARITAEAKVARVVLAGRARR